jgi:FlaA1/EpsC-like NDP-sugar epimerase
LSIRFRARLRAKNTLFRGLIKKCYIEDVMMFDLSEKSALITGASGGIGAEVARVLHSAGAKV